MKFLIFISILLISIKSFCAISLTDGWIACDQKEICIKIEAGSELFDVFPAGTTKVTYTKQLPILSQCSQGNCWLYLGEVADSANVYINDKLIFSTSNNYQSPLYVRHMSFLFPLVIDGSKENKLTIDVFELNQTIFGLRTSNITIGSYDELLVSQAKDFFKRTGITLLSGFSMFLCLFLSLGAYAFRKRKAYLYSATYSLVAVLYLLSFSEFPRFYINALYASGPLHFSLRLAQDATLFLLIHFFFNKKYSRYLFTLLPVYLGCIFTLLISWKFNKTYNFYLYTMYAFSVLLLHPMLYGLYMSKQNAVDRFERRVLLTAFGILTMLQMNDLFFFWQITRGFFFIKIYPPFVVVMFFLLLLRRDILERTDLMLSSELGRIATQVAHDIRSPLTALRILKEVGVDSEEKRSLFSETVDRINNIAEDILFYKRSSAAKIEIINFKKILDEICKEKEVSFSFKTRILHFSTQEEVYVNGNAGQLKRILSNLINNAVEADSKNIEIKLAVSDGFAKLEIIDDGRGIPAHLLKQINSGKYSQEFNGHGLGTSHAYDQIKLWNGFIIFDSEVGRGTKVLLKLPL